MEIICRQDQDNFICSVPFANDNGLEYNNVVQPESVAIFIVISVFLFLWVLDKCYFYIMYKFKKRDYDY
jgi:hypothetical protein